MAQRIAEQHPALPQPVVAKLLAQDAGELDFRIGHAEALGEQVGPASPAHSWASLNRGGDMSKHAQCCMGVCFDSHNTTIHRCTHTRDRAQCENTNTSTSTQVKELLDVYQAGGAAALEAHTPAPLQWERVRQLVEPDAVGLPIGYEPPQGPRQQVQGHQQQHKQLGMGRSAPQIQQG